MAFKEYIISGKLARADQLLTDKSLKIKDIASMLGYDDPYFFSRIYKKYRGHPPHYLRINPESPKINHTSPYKITT